jgi:hypothetical protein
MVRVVIVVALERGWTPTARWRIIENSHMRFAIVKSFVLPLLITGCSSVDISDKPSVPTITHLTTGASHACARFSNGSIRCWGNDTSGELVPPEGAFESVSAGFLHTCGLRPDGSAECWGSNKFGQGAVPDGTYSQISAAYEFTCGLRTDGTIACWGQEGLREEESVVTQAVPTGAFVQVESGWKSACALRENGSVECWGEGYGGIADEAAASGAFARIAKGTSHVCGIKADGTAACWADGDSGNPVVEAPDGVFSSLDAGGSRTCGLRPDGSVECWGYAVAEVPSGPYSLVSSGNYFDCGVGTDGFIRCWGADKPAIPPCDLRGPTFCEDSLGAECNVKFGPDCGPAFFCNAGICTADDPCLQCEANEACFGYQGTGGSDTYGKPTYTCGNGLEGSPCDIDHGCDDGLVCPRFAWEWHREWYSMREPHRCTPPLTEGDECSTEHSACAGPTNCLFGINKCYPPNNIPEGADCHFEGDSCADGLACVDHNFEIGTCGSS